MKGGRRKIRKKEGGGGDKMAVVLRQKIKTERGKIDITGWR